jgi:hypothetical protein
MGHHERQLSSFSCLRADFPGTSLDIASSQEDTTMTKQKTMKLGKLALALGLATIGCGEGAPDGVGEAAEELSSGMHFQNVYTGKCFDIWNGRLVSGSPVDQYTCHSDYQDQAINFVQAPGLPAGFYNLVPAYAPSLCVVPNSTNTIARLVLAPCASAYTAVWTFSQATENSSRYYIQNQYNSGCIDVPSGSTADSVQLQTYPCHKIGSANNQEWLITQ